MLARSKTFHGNSARFNLPGVSVCRTQLDLVKLPPIKQSEASPQRAAGGNNDLARLKAQVAVGSNPKLCFSDTSLFPAGKGNKTAISIHPKFLDEPASSAYYYPGYSPYLMDRDSEQRYFMSGYAGFVPRLRYLGGATYPVMSHDAMDEYDRGRRAHAAALADVGTSPGAAGTAARAAWTADGDAAAGWGRMRGRRGESVIYRTCEGLIPNYQGHVPGHRRRYGRPFGRITINARELPL